MRLRIGSRDSELALWQANRDLLIYEATMGWGAFAGTELEQKLKKSGIDTIVLGGIATNFGVESPPGKEPGLGSLSDKRGFDALFLNQQLDDPEILEIFEAGSNGRLTFK